MPVWFTLYFVGIVTSFPGVYVLLGPPRPSKIASRRLAGIRKPARSAALGVDGADLEREEPWGSMRSLESVLERLRLGRTAKTLLGHANSNLSLTAFLFVSAGSAAAGALIGRVASGMAVVAMPCAAGAGLIPTIVMRIRRNRRVTAFNNALPDAIDLMARCLMAGHSVGSSIEMIGQQAPEPLAFEFVRVYQQQRLGLQFREALLQLAARVPSRDLQFFVTAILVQKETGGDLTEILSRTSHVIRERVRIEGEVRTRTAQGRLTGWILGLLPVVMLVLINIISPGYSHVLFHDPIGQYLMIAGATLIAIGAFVIRRIVNVRV